MMPLRSLPSTHRGLYFPLAEVRVPQRDDAVLLAGEGGAMPKWVKVALIIMGAGLILLIVAGFVGAKALKNTMRNFEVKMEHAKVDGEVFGMTGSLEGCVEEGVNRSGECEGISLSCIPGVGAFMWACLEEASYDQAFCAGVPSAEDDAIVEWGRKVCRKYGQPDHEFCPIGVAVAGGFCDTKRQMR